MITIFEPGKLRLAADLVENSRQQRELYARMGDRMGILVRG
jgi:phosphatidylserine decarboxylase